jgi:FkbM family methyltransferase
MRDSKPFVSYAQNFEDVMIYRALKHVSSGFYIDIGGWDPDRDSVTKAFYIRGWRGINIEPLAKSFAKFKKRRRRDINLNCAVDDSNGDKEFTVVAKSGLSSYNNAIDRQAAERGLKTTKCVVQTRTLASIVEECCTNLHVDFVKIDVEGSELSVISSIDWNVFRPTLVVVESIDPMSGEINSHIWESILINARYRFVWFDGLNNFYLRDEDSQLEVHFKKPVSVTDDFRLYPINSFVPGWRSLLSMFWDYLNND